MEFNFLPNLPKSNLDDRTYKDLVDECILRIPRYCPEWTNYNAADPGITLIELFSWLTDQMLLRFNQVPRRNYVAFLELLGIRLQPATPATTAITFYLAAALSNVYQIPQRAEVATERTETEEAIVFSTDLPLTIGIPRIRHFLTAETVERQPQTLRDRFANLWTQSQDGSWEGREQPVFSERPQPGNCFYLVFEPDEPLDGNVIALTLHGEPAEATGINPDNPPRRWEAWDGTTWVSVLRVETDDSTRGFSFDVAAPQDLNVVQEADVVLHMPQQWSSTYFSTYHGRWLRCVYTEPDIEQAGYSRPPRLLRCSARSIGGTVDASQCTLVQDELVGESDGNPGQSFELQSKPVLQRLEGEHLMVIPPGGLPQIWQEVPNFADSGPDDRHYTINSLTGQIQLGPLIREPAQLKEDLHLRARVQQRQAGYQPELDAAAVQLLERQYGAVPPRGATLRMVAYRTGGGQRGNVQAGTLQILKSAIPYVARVVNHGSARNGADSESLEDAVIRVPRMLRTRDRAVTPEDFESLALQASSAVARARCPTEAFGNGKNGIVNVLIVPQVDIASIERGEGISPSQLSLTPQLQQTVLAFLNERRLLGIQVRLQEPDYVGVSVQTEVGLEPEYKNPQAQQDILRSLQLSLYRFLNPLTGGPTGTGWAFGSPLYTSDIVSLFQKVPGVRYLGTILLFELRQQGQDWIRTPIPNGIVNPGPLGLICSWADPVLRSGHAISLDV